MVSNSLVIIMTFLLYCQVVMIIFGRNLTDFPTSLQAKEQGKAEADEMITKLEKVVYKVHVIAIRLSGC